MWRYLLIVAVLSLSLPPSCRALKSVASRDLQGARDDSHVQGVDPSASKLGQVDRGSVKPLMRGVSSKDLGANISARLAAAVEKVRDPSLSPGEAVLQRLRALEEKRKNSASLSPPVVASRRNRRGRSQDPSGRGYSRSVSPIVLPEVPSSSPVRSFVCPSPSLRQMSVCSLAHVPSPPFLLCVCVCLGGYGMQWVERRRPCVGSATPAHHQGPHHT